MYQGDQAPFKSKPDDLICPLAGQIFDEPVKADGLPTVERSWIEREISRKGQNPFTRQSLSASQLVSDIDTKNKVAEFIQGVQERNMQMVVYQP